ncbi:MAG: hypothetical protein PWP54_1412 [Thermosipho sp. (in: thermotogales)]|nr:hypothetical protein [Thermosipho sp. (in: thermotogales)]MDK2900141.1 hypothetical protein [Thermosipho sp. (in: thermotogales)]
MVKEWLEKHPQEAEKIYFLPFRKDAIELMADFDVFLLTSDSEGMPLVVLEALNLGIPVVSTDVGCVGELTDFVFKGDKKGVEFLIALDKLNASKLSNSYTIFLSSYVDLYIVHNFSIQLCRFI